MPNETVDVELKFDLADYVRASTRLLFSKPTFVGILALMGFFVLYSMYMAIRQASTMGLGQALMAQAPVLMFLLIPVVMWFTLRRQGTRIIARQRAAEEHITYTFSDDGFIQRVTSNQGKDEHSGNWDTFAKVLETPEDFLLLLPRQGGVFLPKKCFGSDEKISAFRELVRRRMGSRAKLRA